MYCPRLGLIFLTMPKKKGKEKNTTNKAKHKKLLNRKLKKEKLQKEQNKVRLKAIIKKANEVNNSNK